MDTDPDTGLDTGPYTDEPKPVQRRVQVYAELQRMIMVGDFGVQTRLVEERLAARLGVSRTPVREALVRLLSDGLVIRHEGGYYVALPDLSRLRDLYELRITLELRGLSRALESPGMSHDPTLLEPLRDQWRAMDLDRPDPDPQFVLVDEDFHVTLMRSTGNFAMTESLQSVNARIRAVRMYDFLTEDRIDLTIREHLEVVGHVLDGDVQAALVALQRHVGISMEVVERRAARAVSLMALHRGSPR